MLALRLLQWRHTWRFRFAHHPLCRHFHGHVWRAGPLRLCVGCTCLWSGAAVGLALWPHLPPVAWLPTAAIVAAGSWPPW